MFECYACRKKYEIEDEAKVCCTQVIEYNDGSWDLPKKTRSMKPVASGHYCPNVNAGNRKWSTMLYVDEKCPMCDYEYKPR